MKALGSLIGLQILAWILGDNDLCVLRMRKQMHHGLMEKMGLWDAGNARDRLGFSTGSLQSLWLDLSSCSNLWKELFVCFYFPAGKTEKVGKDLWILFLLIVLDCRILEISWHVGETPGRSSMEFWTPGLWGTTGWERQVGCLEGKTPEPREFSISKNPKAKEYFHFEVWKKIPQDLEYLSHRQNSWAKEQQLEYLGIMGWNLSPGKWKAQKQNHILLLQLQRNPIPKF